MLKNPIFVFTFGETAYRMGEQITQKGIDRVVVTSFMHPKEIDDADCVLTADDESFRKVFQKRLTHKTLNNRIIGLFYRIFRIKEAPKVIILIAGLGGIYGSKFVVEAARLAQGAGYEHITAILQLPFDFEGFVRRERANTALEGVRKYTTDAIVFDHSELAKQHQSMALGEYFSLIEQQTIEAVKKIVTQFH
jgi:hypothetical protein